VNVYTPAPSAEHFSLHQASFALGWGCVMGESEVVETETFLED
jgi:hypothetical protein